MLAPTTAIKDKVTLKWVLETGQIISWMASQDSRCPCKKCPSMKICRSLGTTLNSTDTGPLQSTESATLRSTGPNQETRTTSSMATSETSSSVESVETYQGSQMKRLLWKQDRLLLLDWPIKVRASTRKTKARTATSSSLSDKYSKTEPMSRTSSLKQSSNKLIRRICQASGALEAKRMYLLSVQTMHSLVSQSSNFHKERTNRWTRPLPLLSVLRSSIKLAKAL